MADVKWSTLFPKTGGSGRGGAFTGKVLTPAMSPYQVVAGDRLVIAQTDQPMVIDPSNLKDDEAFQVIDASRNFDKNPVTIKGDKLAIQIVGAGNDLILDMIGAGNLWEFIANGGQLLVADSPGYTGELPAGGGGTVDLTGVPVFEFGQGDPLNTQHPAGGGNRDLIYISMGVPGSPVDEAGMWRWPAGAPADNATGQQWQKILFTTDDELALNLAARPIWIHGNKEPTSLDDTGGLAGGPSEVYYVNTATGHVFAWPANRPRKDENTVPNLWTSLRIGGAPGFTTVSKDGARDAQSFDVAAGECFVVNIKDGATIGPVTVNLPAAEAGASPIRVLRTGGRAFIDLNGSDQTDVIIKALPTTKIVGTWDDFDGEGPQIALSAPGEFAEFFPLVLPDEVVWLITGGGYSEVDSSRVTRISGDSDARSGYIMQCENSCTITLPRVDPGGEPIIILNGSREYDPRLGGFNNITVKVVVPRDPVDDNYTLDSVWGIFRGKQFAVNVSGKDDIQLTKAGEWVMLTPTAAGWLISGSTMSS